MADIYDREKRSEVMSRVRGSGNRSTELRLIAIFRKHSITGWRRNQRLPGLPDFVFPKQRLAVFVDGCFWHGCPLHGSVPREQTSVFGPTSWPRTRREIGTSIVFFENADGGCCVSGSMNCDLLSRMPAFGASNERVRIQADVVLRRLTVGFRGAFGVRQRCRYHSLQIGIGAVQISQPHRWAAAEAAVAEDRPQASRAAWQAAVRVCPDSSL